MITKTITWSFFYKDELLCEADKIGIIEQKDVSLENYLEDIYSQKSLLDKNGITRISVFHTVFYDDQCNTEFSPKVVSMLQKLNATFCVTAQNNSSNESLYDVLDKIRERPAMYLGEHSLSAMSHFINGFDMARNHETHETPPFDGFNDFVGKFYGKYTTAGWKNLILSDHYGNENEALTRFYELLDEFRGQEIKFNSRDIVLRLLHVSMLDFRGEDEHERQKQIADLLHHVSNGLRTAIFGGLIVWFDSILEDIFNRANGNEYLHHWIKLNAPETADYEYELWHGFDGSTNITTLIPGNHQQKDYVIDPCEKLIKRFFTMKLEKAKEVKENFMTTIDQRNKDE